MESKAVRALDVVLSKHAVKRLKERFSLSREAAERFAKDVVVNGNHIYTIDGYLKFEKNGHSYIYTLTKQKGFSGQVLLMVTACNEEKGREWVQYVRGDKKTFSTTKGSKINRGASVQKNKSGKQKYKNYFDDEMCA